MSSKDPLDKKALAVVLCAVAFLVSFGYLLTDQWKHNDATPAVGGSGPGAPGSDPKENPQKK